MYRLNFNNDENFGNVIIKDDNLWIEFIIETKLHTNNILRVFGRNNDSLIKIGILEPDNNILKLKKRISKTSLNNILPKEFFITYDDNITNIVNETIEFNPSKPIDFAHQISLYKIENKNWIKKS